MINNQVNDLNQICINRSSGDISTINYGFSWDLCILYREGVSDDRAILDILNVTADTFRSLKSRLRKKLKDAPENQYIAEVLDVMGR